MCSSEKAKYYELLVHFPIQYIDFEKDFTVLIVGGGNCLALQEVVKYRNAKRIVVIELDDMITRICEKHFDVERMDDDSRVHWMFSNVTRTIGSLLEKGDTFDLILVDTSLQSDAINENKEFYTNLSRLMTRRAIIVKNGEKSEVFMRTALPWTLNYGFSSKTSETRSSFVVGNTWFDFRDYRLRADSWNRLGVKAHVYDPDRHYEYLRWTDLVTKSQLERIGADKPDKYRPYYNAINEESSRENREMTESRERIPKPKEKSLDEILGREKLVDGPRENIDNEHLERSVRKTREDREDRKTREDREIRKTREEHEDRKTREEHEDRKTREDREDHKTREDREEHEDRTP
jgi:spermidine synthase